MVLAVLIISFIVSIISLVISKVSIISIIISKLSILIHCSAPLRKQEILGRPAVY